MLRLLVFRILISVFVCGIAQTSFQARAMTPESSCPEKLSFMWHLKQRSGYLAFGVFGKENAAVGETEKLGKFVKLAATKFSVPVFTYHDYGWTELAPSKTQGFSIQNVKSAIETMMKRWSGEKVILFNLDDVDIARAMKADLGGAPMPGYEGTNFTGAELKLILSNPSYYQATRWFRNGVELTPLELQEFEKTTESVRAR